jgi:hypothetical protein
MAGSKVQVGDDLNLAISDDLVVSLQSWSPTAERNHPWQGHHRSSAGFWWVQRPFG